MIEKGKRKKQKLGFALIELIIVIAIVAGLGAVGVTKVAETKKSVEQKNLDACAETVRSAVQAHFTDLVGNSQAGLLKNKGNEYSGIAKPNDYTQDGSTTFDASQMRVLIINSSTKSELSSLIPKTNGTVSAGNWMIEYNKYNGAVYSVAYSDEISFDGWTPETLDQYRNIDQRKGSKIGYALGKYTQANVTDGPLTPKVSFEPVTGIGYCVIFRCSLPTTLENNVNITTKDNNGGLRYIYSIYVDGELKSDEVTSDRYAQNNDNGNDFECLIPFSEIGIDENETIKVSVRAKGATVETTSRTDTGRYTFNGYGASATVEVVNKEELLVKASAPKTEGANEQAFTFTFYELTANGTTSGTAVVKTVTTNAIETINNEEYFVYSYVVDSLKDGKQFNQNFPFTPGCDVEVSVTTTHDSDEATAEFNSLFDSVTGGTANIAYGRHLQNLDYSTSKVNNNITKAVQIQSINFGVGSSKVDPSDWAIAYATPDATYPILTFTPIVNSNLVSLEALNNYAINDIIIISSDVTGLFGSHGKTLAINNITLNRAYVEGSNDTGAFVGRSSGSLANITINNCKLYNAIVKSNGNTNYAAGMVGNVYGNVTVQNCKVEGLNVSTAATNADVGGIFGRVYGNATITGTEVKNSQIKSTVSAQTGGLIGYANGQNGTSQVTISNTTTSSLSVIGAGETGGFIGLVSSASVTISGSWNANPNITGSARTGGIVGLIVKSPTTSINTTNVTNPTVNSGSEGGGFIGSLGYNVSGYDGGSVNFTDSHVYIDGTRSGNAFRFEGTAIDTLNYGYVQAASGCEAGGLIGYIYGGSVAISKSSASVGLISGNTGGGLIALARNASGKNNIITIDQSYADCYISASKYAGGLVGGKSESYALTITNSYAAGYLHVSNTSGVTAGLVANGEGYNGSNVNIANSYSAVVCNENEVSRHYSIAAKIKSASNVYYTFAGEKDYSKDSSDCSVSITPVSNEAAANISTFSTALNNNVFAAAVYTKAYNIDALNHTTYDYPAIKSIGHYGDWAAFEEIQEDNSIATGFVYYEVYKNSDGTLSYGLWKLDGSIPEGSDYGLKNNKNLVGDGYGIVFCKKDKTKTASVTDSTGVSGMGSFTVGYNKTTGYEVGDGSTLYPFPVKLMTPIRCGKLDSYSQQFYSTVSITYSNAINGGTVSGTKNLYTPYYAKGIYEYQSNVGNKDFPSHVYIRSARQLFGLSYLYGQYKDIHGNNSGLKSVTFDQTLDIDYNTYAWSSYTDISSYYTFNWSDYCDSSKCAGRVGGQFPIGPDFYHFESDYDGHYHYIKNVKLQGLRNDQGYYVLGGLFGYTEGNVLTKTVKSASTPYEVQYTANYVEIKNVFMVFDRAGDTENNRINNVTLAGGLIGRAAQYTNIENCGVKGYQFYLQTSETNKYDFNAYNSVVKYGEIGGFVGWVDNDVTITNCTAEVSAVVNVDTSSPKTLRIGGFVGWVHACSNGWNSETSYSHQALAEIEGCGAILSIGTNVDSSDKDKVLVRGFAAEVNQWDNAGLTNCYAVLKELSGWSNSTYYSSIYCKQFCNYTTSTIYTGETKYPTTWRKYFYHGITDCYKYSDIGTASPNTDATNCSSIKDIGSKYSSYDSTSGYPKILTNGSSRFIL